MNPRALLLIVLVVVVVVLLAAWLWSRRSSSRRADLVRARRELNLALVAIQQISLQVDLYRDIDSPLAAAVRPTLTEFNTKRLELYK